MSRSHALRPRGVEAPGAASHVASLTGLRIVAASLVFLTHTGGDPRLPSPVRTFMSAGYTGVTVFFILSGFVLAWNYAGKDFTSASTLRSFFVARLARVYPLYLVALLGVVLLQRVGGYAPTFSTILPHLLAVQTWSPDFGTAFAFNGPGWSIGVEFFLYACFPVVMIALRRVRRSVWILVAIGALVLVAAFALAWWFAATGRNALPIADADSAHRWLYRMPLTRLGDFVLGVIAALLVQRSRPPLWASRAAQTVGGVSLVALMASPTVLLSAWSWDSAYMLPVFLLLWGLASGPGTALARLLGTRPLVLAGEASFAFYLLHVPLMNLLVLQGADSLGAWIATTGLEFAIIMLVAVGAHTAVERPAQRWLRRTLDRPRRPAAPAPAPRWDTREIGDVIEPSATAR